MMTSIKEARVDYAKIAAALAQLDSADARGIAGAARKCADDLANIVEASVRVAHRTGNSFLLDRNKTASMIAGYFTGLLPDASPGNGAEKVREAALGLLAAEDERQSKLHELLETIREQIRLEVKPEHRPKGLFKNIQDAVYAMRGRTALLNDAAIIAALHSTSAAGETTSSNDPNSILRAIWNDIEFAAVEAPTDDYQSDDIRPETLARLANYLDARRWKDKADEVHRQPNVDTSSDDRRSAVACDPVRRSGAADLSQPVDQHSSKATPADVREESSKQYRDAVDRVNRSTDRKSQMSLAMKEACKRAVYEADYLKDALANIDAIEIDKLSPEVKADASPPDWKQDQAETTRIKPPATAEGGRGEPVAWRYRFVTSMQRDWSDWFIVDDAKSIPNRPLPDVEIQPIYTHPASPPDVEAIRADERERCAAEIERRNYPTVGDAQRIASAIRTGGQK